jgi:small multidrug resistance pump
MTGPFADRLFRITFAVAGIYNFAFGLWAALWPLAFFEWFDVAAPRYPGIWACVGMVVGVYGLLYLYSAWNLDAAWPIIAVGLLGKVLGPIGMFTSFDTDWPRRLGMLCVFNDLIWWLPFGLFLIRRTSLAQLLARFAPLLCAASHAAALLAMLFWLRHGLHTEINPAARASFLTQNPQAWVFGWSLWMFAGASLVGFHAWWGSRLSARTLATVAVLITALGMVLDFTGEGLLLFVLVERVEQFATNPAAYTSIEHRFTLISAAGANGLYTLTGILLTLATPNLPAAIRSAMWITWLAGIAMTIAAVLGHVVGMVICTAFLFPLLIAWTTWMGVRWRSA